MTECRILALLCIVVASTEGCRQVQKPTETKESERVPQSREMGGAKSVMTFFVTSRGPGRGGDLGGLSGADAHCQALAQAEGAGDHTWRADLSGAGKEGQPRKKRAGRGGKRA